MTTTIPPGLTKDDISRHYPWPPRTVHLSAAIAGVVAGMATAFAVPFRTTGKMPRSLAAAIDSFSPQGIVLTAIAAVILAMMTSLATANASTEAPLLTPGTIAASQKRYRRWYKNATSAQAYAQVRHGIRILTLTASYGYLLGTTIVLASGGPVATAAALGAVEVLLALLALAIYCGDRRVAAKARTQRDVAQRITRTSVTKQRRSVSPATSSLRRARRHFDTQGQRR